MGLIFGGGGKGKEKRMELAGRECKNKKKGRLYLGTYPKLTTLLVFTFDTNIADRAYTLFDGLVFKNTHRFQLYMTPDGIKDQVPNAPIFQINHLPLSMTNEGLYNLFRPFGPIRLCKIIMEKDASFNGTALLQYFDQQHAENAKKTMVCTL
ncbi:hypothetical protein BC941DRAFT_431728 [Chlamydoabsidia padenii]|nr:hypothetical protein BC941DRAFT_431728 [Chlamydoabsidia padenii]